MEVPSQSLSDFSDAFGNLFPADLCLLAPRVFGQNEPRDPLFCERPKKYVASELLLF